jgi:hypothetical protein
MKAIEFGNYLSKLALQLRELQSFKYSEALYEAGNFFKQRSASATVATTLKLLSKIQREEQARGTSTNDLCCALKIANITMADFGKPAVSKDLGLVVSQLEKFSETDLNELLQQIHVISTQKTSKSKAGAVREDVIDFYASRLEDTINQPSDFRNIYDEIGASGTLSVAELKKLAKKFRGSSVGSKKAALEAIWARHNALMDAQARKAASGGRSAA